MIPLAIRAPLGLKSGHIVPWDKLDVTDPGHMKLKCTVAELDARPR
jgi:hypothetical protein